MLVHTFRVRCIRLCKHTMPLYFFVVQSNSMLYFTRKMLHGLVYLYAGIVYTYVHKPYTIKEYYVVHINSMLVLQCASTRVYGLLQERYLTRTVLFQVDASCYMTLTFFLLSYCRKRVNDLPGKVLYNVQKLTAFNYRSDVYNIHVTRISM